MRKITLFIVSAAIAGATSLNAAGIAQASPAYPPLASLGSTATSAQPARIARAITPLPGCAVTFVSRVAGEQGRRCLQAATASARLSPSASIGGCDLDYYQNGPYGSQAWANGWGVCVLSGQNGGSPFNYFVPRSFNDQASSWDSCTSGIFYANQPGTTPNSSFPANSFGNFPWGAVPNDSLSSIRINDNPLC